MNGKWGGTYVIVIGFGLTPTKETLQEISFSLQQLLFLGP